MVAPFHAWTIEDGAICAVLEQDLTLEDFAVLEREMKDVPMCRVRHRIEPDDRRLSGEIQQAVSHAAEIAMTTMQTPDSAERLSLRHLLHTEDSHARSAPVAGACAALHFRTLRATNSGNPFSNAVAVRSRSLHGWPLQFRCFRRFGGTATHATMKEDFV